MIYFYIDKTAKIPLYKQIIEQVIDKIKTNQVKHLDLLPSEVQFESIYHVSSFVIKRAYKSLEQMGYIKRIKGKGTFINTRKTYVANAFDVNTIALPYREDINFNILSVDLIDHQDRICRTLKVECDHEIKKLKVIALDQKMPVSYTELYVNQKRAFNKKEWLSFKKPLKTFFENIYQEEIKMISTSNAAAADKIFAELLYILVQDPMIVVNTTYYLKDTPIAHAITFYPGEFTEIEALTYERLTHHHPN